MRVTYLLGAGASYHAIPTYSDFNGALARFVDFIDWYCKVVSAAKKNPQEFGAIPIDFGAKIEEFKSMTNECRYFGTPDTYAVSIAKDKERLQKLKALISCFLYFLHFEVKGGAADLAQVPAENPLQDIRGIYLQNEATKDVKARQVSLDRRYTNFWSSVFSQNLTVPPENLYFLTWNYDFQLEKALYLFMPDILAIRKYLDTRLIQINGNCKISMETHIYEKYLTRVHMKDIIDHLFKEGERSQGIKFSWEEGNSFNQAQSYVNKANALAVIGYSFPEYNRRNDMSLFQNYNKKVYIQDMDTDGIWDKIGTINKNFSRFQLEQEREERRLVHNYKHDEKVNPIKSTNQFVIPIEFWN